MKTKLFAVAALAVLFGAGMLPAPQYNRPTVTDIGAAVVVDTPCGTVAMVGDVEAAEYILRFAFPAPLNIRK